jgi:hypothetical protein
MPYTIDLVRLATSARLAITGGHLGLAFREACDAILDGYREGLSGGGRAVVLAEKDRWLRRIALSDLRDPMIFWNRIDALPNVSGEVPAGAQRALRRLLPKGLRRPRFARRRAGEGSLGRQRIVAVAEWQGATIAREAKSLVPSAWEWAHANESTGSSQYQQALDRSVRCADPYVRVEGGWIVRRIGPDCSRVELAELPKKLDEARLLRTMGWETANVHLGTPAAMPAVKADLRGRSAAWLHRAGREMAEAVKSDWKDWRRSFSAHPESH